MVDRPLAEYVKALDGTSHGLIDFFRSFTDFGKASWYLWPSGISVIFCSFLSRGEDVPPRYRRLFGYVGIRALFLFGAVGVSGIVADILKVLAGRARPLLWLKDWVYGFEPGALSFLWHGMPSGHAATAFAVAFCLVKMYPRWQALWFACALLLASSRVMVDAHYLSDVLAGAALGWLIAGTVLATLTIYASGSLWLSAYTGQSLRSVAVTHFFDDVQPDLAVADWGANTVSVLLGVGTGTFAAKVDYPTGTNPHGLAVGDLGNGEADLVVANASDNTISVMLGKGDGALDGDSFLAYVRQVLAPAGEPAGSPPSRGPGPPIAQVVGAVGIRPTEGPRHAGCSTSPASRARTRTGSPNEIPTGERPGISKRGQRLGRKS